MTSQETADKLGVSRRTVHRMHDDGRLVGKRLASGALVFDRATVEQMARAQEAQQR